MKASLENSLAMAQMRNRYAARENLMMHASQV